MSFFLSPVSNNPFPFLAFKNLKRKPSQQEKDIKALFARYVKEIFEKAIAESKEKEKDMTYLIRARDLVSLLSLKFYSEKFVNSIPYTNEHCKIGARSGFSVDVANQFLHLPIPPNFFENQEKSTHLYKSIKDLRKTIKICEKKFNYKKRIEIQTKINKKAIEVGPKITSKHFEEYADKIEDLFIKAVASYESKKSAHSYFKESTLRKIDNPYSLTNLLWSFNPFASKQPSKQPNKEEYERKIDTESEKSSTNTEENSLVFLQKSKLLTLKSTLLPNSTISVMHDFSTKLINLHLFTKKNKSICSSGIHAFFYYLLLIHNDPALARRLELPKNIAAEFLKIMKILTKTVPDRSIGMGSAFCFSEGKKDLDDHDVWRKGIQKAYGTELKLNQNKNKINQWVEEKTCGLIKDLLKQDLYKKTASLVTYFCFSAYHNKGFTSKPCDFFPLDQKEGLSNVEMMQAPHQMMKVWENEKALIIAMPFKSSTAVFMTLCLPKDNSSAAFSKAKKLFFSPKFPHLMKSHAQSKKVRLTMPKINVKTASNLKAVFPALGLPIPDNFSNHLRIDKIEAQDGFECDEKGARGAAAAGSTPESCFIIQAPKMDAVYNRPFLLKIDYYVSIDCKEDARYFSENELKRIKKTQKGVLPINLFNLVICKDATVKKSTSH